MFLDHFSDGVVDLLQRTGNGTITEPAGTQLRLYIPDGVDAPINPTASALGCPVAYKGAGIVSPHKVNGPWCFDLKLDQLTNGNNTVIAGLLAWKGDIEELHSTAYTYEMGYYPNESAILIHNYLGSWSGTRLATSAQTKPNGTVKHIYRIIINPLDRIVHFTDVGFGGGSGWVVNPNSIYFAFSADGGATWTGWHQRTMEFQVDYVGVHMRNWSSAGGVTHEALYDYFSISAYDWDAKTHLYVPSIPTIPTGDPDTSDPRTKLAMEDDVNLTRGSGGQTDHVIQEDRGVFFPGPVEGAGEFGRQHPEPVSLEDQARIMTFPDDEQHFVLPGAREEQFTGGRPDAQSAEDDVQLPNQSGLGTFFSLPELNEPVLLPIGAGRQVMGAEDSLLWELGGADYQDDKLDGDGKELLYSTYNVQAVLRVDNTVGTFGNPGTGHYGAAKDGKFYFNGVECSAAAPTFGTVAGGPNRIAWPWWSGTGPFGKDLQAGHSITIPSDGTIRMVGATMADGSYGVMVSSRNGWHFPPGEDFDIQIDYANLVKSGGGDGGLMMACQADPYNLFYVRRQSQSIYDKNAHIGGSGQSYTSVGTSDTSGKMRITRTGSTMRAYYWTGAVWAQIGGDYSHSNLSGRLFVTISAWGVSNNNIDVEVSNFTINSGAWDNHATWYDEASGAHRGIQQAMPDHMAIVATQQSVDLIDTDTDKLWMRFVKGTNNALHYFSAQSQYTRDLSWSNGKLVLAHGSSPSASQEGGTIMIDFSTELIRTTREAASTICGGTYSTYTNYSTYAYPPGMWPIAARNNNSTYVNDYDDWQVQDYRVYAVSILHDGFNEFVASGTLEGLTIHKTRRWHVSQSNRDYNWPNRSLSTESSEIKCCRFRSDGTIFYADATNLYSRDRTNGGLTGWEDVMDAGTFSAEKTEALPGTRVLRAQYIPVFYGSYVFLPADEGVYRINWVTGSWELFYGVGGTCDILQAYTRVNAISLANDGTYDLLVVSLETATEARINVVKLLDNSLYGVTVPATQINAAQAVAS